MDPDASPVVDANPDPPDCEEPAQSPGTGRHNPGAACLSCHTGGGAPAFTIAGTLYTDAAGSAPVVGATVHVVDADGKDIKMISADNGNFWYTGAVTFPVSAAVSRCPDRAEMTQAVNQAGGNCNSAGCHSGTSRIHLP